MRRSVLIFISMTMSIFAEETPTITISYMLDTVNSRRNKILDGVGKITEPSWSR